MSWLFIDSVCPAPYSLNSLSKPGIGGTEATVIRVAEGLGDSLVMQHNRSIDNRGEGRVQYLRPTWDQIAGVSAVVVLRCPETALAARQRFKAVPVYLWVHDLATPALAGRLDALKAKGIELACVSNFHRHNITEAYKTYHSGTDAVLQLPKIHVVYNPIEDSLAKDGTPLNPNKLVFFSSPHKGLAWALECFQAARRSNPNLEFYIANPGYIPIPPLSLPGVHVLGDLPRAEALRHVRGAFCVFYPNHCFPETFGLVLAEANALGTPVLTHPHGAAREVLDNQAQLVDCKDLKKVVDTLEQWQLPGNRPVVAGQEQFKLTRVLRQWQSLN